MKKISSIIFILFWLSSNSQNSNKIRFGKTQYYLPIKSEKQQKLTDPTIKAYAKLYPDSLEIPLNRLFQSDSAIVFVGISFKKDLKSLYNELVLFGDVKHKEINSKLNYFIIQCYINKAYVNRYAYYSKKDKLLYLLNYTFIPNNEKNLDEFKTIVTRTIK